jgi:epoxyqueuosine reductase
MTSLKARIFDKAAELGFCAWGIARADAVPQAGEELRQWIAAGHHGEMGWIEERAEQRASPNALARGEVGDRAGHELCAGDRSADVCRH